MIPVEVVRSSTKRFAPAGVVVVLPGIRTNCPPVPVPLVLHGSSGVADEDLRKAVAAGITKINVGTLLNVQFTNAVRGILDSDGAVTDPRRYLTPAREAVADAVTATIAAVN